MQARPPLAGFLLLAALAAPLHSSAQDLKLDPQSPFYRELRASPLPRDPAEALVTAYLFRRGTLNDEGIRLEHWIDRIRIKAFLGERLPVAATVGEALELEAAATEPYLALKDRATKSVVAIARAADSHGVEPQQGGSVKYHGNSVWEGGYSGHVVWMRVKATNRSPQPIRSMAFEIRADGVPPWLLLFRDCEFEGGVLPPKSTGFASCRNDSDRPADSIQALAADTLRATITPRLVELPGLRLSATGDSFVEPSPIPEASRKAMETLDATACEQLNACEQRARREAQEEKRRREFVPSYILDREREEAQAQRVRRLKAGFTAFAILGALFVFIAPMPAERPKGRGLTALAFLLLVASGITIVSTLALIFSLDSKSLAIVVFFAAAVAAGIVTLILSAALGIAMWDRARRTRFRMGSLGIGLGALAVAVSPLLPNIPSAPERLAHETLRRIVRVDRLEHQHQGEDDRARRVLRHHRGDGRGVGRVVPHRA